MLLFENGFPLAIYTAEKEMVGKRKAQGKAS
jgi:hypothetical protein